MHPQVWLGSHRPDGGSDPDLDIALAQHNFEVNHQFGRWIARSTTAPFSVGRREGSAQCVSSREVSRDQTHIVAVGDGYELHDRDSYHGTFVKAEEVSERGFVHGGHFKLGRTGGAELGQRLVLLPVVSVSASARSRVGLLQRKLVWAWRSCESCLR